MSGTRDSWTIGPVFFCTASFNPALHFAAPRRCMQDGEKIHINVKTTKTNSSSISSTTTTSSSSSNAPAKPFLLAPPPPSRSARPQSALPAHPTAAAVAASPAAPQVAPLTANNTNTKPASTSGFDTVTALKVSYCSAYVVPQDVFGASLSFALCLCS